MWRERTWTVRRAVHRGWEVRRRGRGGGQGREDVVGRMAASEAVEEEEEEADGGRWLWLLFFFPVELIQCTVQNAINVRHDVTPRVCRQRG